MDYAARMLVSYQHIFFYPLMAFGRINLYVQVRGRARGRGGGGGGASTYTAALRRSGARGPAHTLPLPQLHATPSTSPPPYPP